MNEEKLVFSWENVGTLEISVRGNMSATLRFDADTNLLKEYDGKSAKTTANVQNTLRQPYTPLGENTPHKR